MQKLILDMPVYLAGVSISIQGRQRSQRSQAIRCQVTYLAYIQRKGEYCSMIWSDERLSPWTIDVR